MNRLKIILLIGIAALDAGAVIFAVRSFAFSGAEESVPARPAPLLVPASQSESFAAPAGEDTATLSRPLFSKTRRPAPGKKNTNGPTEAAGSLPAGLKVRAVIAYRHAAQGFVRSNALSEGKWLSVGEKIENWTVDAITADGIDLRRETEIARVGLDYNDGSASACPNCPPSQKTASAEAPNPSPEAKAIAPDALDLVKASRRARH